MKRGYALALRDVHKRFGRMEIIRGVNLSISPGECHALIGPNGAGKSTLFNLITGRHRVSRGRIELHGDDITGAPPHKIARRGLTRSFQITNLFAGMTAFENLRCALLWARGYRYSFRHLLGRQQALNAEATAWLERLGLGDRRELPASSLSYAEQRTLEVGTAIAAGADVVLLDEPTAGMSPAERDRALAVIRDVTRDKTLLVVEHDMAVVFDLADRISVLAHGRILASGAPDAISSDARVREAYLGVTE